ncbi:MAG: CBS domain-containing protein [Peptococcaceae bacterium]|nr:CBS domain-containing protein [Peptococcaceae bacterium]
MQNKVDTVAGFMIPLTDYSTIHKNATLEEAVNLMHASAREKGYRWVLVLDDGGKITGILTLRAVFEALGTLAPRAGGWLGISFNRPDLFFWEGLKLIKDTPVTRFVRPVVEVYVMESDPPSRAMEVIMKRRVTIVPVLDKDLKVVGIIRPVDLLPFIKMLFETQLA